MNERLEDLMYESGLTAQGCLDMMDDYDRNAIEKFARLIIQDCIDTLSVSDPKEDFDRGILWSRNQIKEHFGVEE